MSLPFRKSFVVTVRGCLALRVDFFDSEVQLRKQRRKYS